MEIAAEVIKFLSANPTLQAALVLLVVFNAIGPWVFSVLNWRDGNKKFDALKDMVKEQKDMYEKNAALADRALTLAEEHQQLVIMSATVMTQVKEKVEDCPRGGIPK